MRLAITDMRRRLGTSSTVLVAAGGALMVAVLVLAAWFGWQHHRNMEENEITQGELFARVLEDHATRNFETGAVALGALAELLAKPIEVNRINPLLVQTLSSLPFLRSVAVVDRRGRVLGSSATDETGLRIDLGRFGPLPAIGRDAIGHFVVGRGLADMTQDRPKKVVPAGVGFIPLIRYFDSGAAEPWLLVAVINPDAFANFQQLTLASAEAGTTAALATYQGVLLATPRGVATPLGSSLSQHPVFKTYLPSQEHGTFIGTGLDAEEQLVAFRVSRTRPLVVVVEQSYADLTERWLTAMRWPAFVAAVMVILIASMTWLAWRNLRAREVARLALDHAQARTVQSERELSILVRSVQELIFRTDAAGTITFVNARWAMVSGRAHKDAIGSRLQDIIAPDCHALVDALFSPDRTDGVRNVQVGVPRIDGVRQLDITVVPLRSATGVIGFVGSAMDMTERLADKARLKAELEFSALLLEISPLPVNIVDAKGRVTYVNRAWETFFGLARADVLGRSQSLLPGSAYDFQLDLNSQSEQSRYEAQIRHHDGSVRDVVVIRAQVSSNAPVRGSQLEALMDVTEFRDAERATREARDAAEEASRVKSEFIANVSHELRTPLQSIIGFSELGLTRGKEQERLAMMFREINGAGQRMLSVVNDLLDVSKIESSVGAFHLERTDLRPLLRDVARELDPLLASRQLTLQFQLSDVPLVAKVDPLRFQQVIRNVLANAIKFSPMGRSIHIAGEMSDMGEVHISVMDHGPGIPDSELGKIFDAFVQSSKTKDGSGGTGLGLAICRKIMEAHGGEIHAENVAGGGTVFCIKFPARGYTATIPAPL